MRLVDQAALEEARHLGLAYAFGLPCVSATARIDGSGAGVITLLTRNQLQRIHALDQTLALDVITSYLAVAITGDETPSSVDAQLADQARHLYRAITGRDSDAFELRAETRAARFCLTQRAGIERFASELASAGYLDGSRLQRALERCFTRERQAVPTGTDLEVWLARRKAELEQERRAQAEVERKAAYARRMAYVEAEKQRFREELGL